MMEIYYVNNRGIKLDLLSIPYRIQTGDLFDYRWEYKNLTRKSGKIIGFKRTVRSKKLLLGISNKNKKSYYEALDHFHETIEQDILDGIPGRLYVGKTYMNCYIIASAKTNWEYDINVLDNDIELISENSFWITEKTFFFQQSDSSNQGTSFPFDFPFDFAGTTKGNSMLNNDHYAEADFRMTIYGSCMNPQITIGGYTYSVNTTVEENEYLIINSREGTVIRVQQDGTHVNEFNNRSTAEKGVFRKIPAGNLNVNWSGDFGFDITLYQERSEPKWS